MLDIRSFDLHALVARTIAEHRAQDLETAEPMIASDAGGRYFGDAIRLRKSLRLMLAAAGKAGELSVERGGAAADAEEAVEIVFTLAGGEPTDERVDDRLHSLVSALNAQFDIEDTASGPLRRLRVRLAPIRPGDEGIPDLRRDGRVMRVLIAEDDAMSRRVIAEMVARTGAEIGLAEDGETALALWQTGRWDIALMDVRMPQSDGLMTTRAIRAAEMATEQPPMPIVALTAATTPHQIELCDQAGADAVITKPVQMDYLYSTLRRLLLPTG